MFKDLGSPDIRTMGDPEFDTFYHMPNMAIPLEPKGGRNHPKWVLGVVLAAISAQWGWPGQSGPLGLATPIFFFFNKNKK
jgi:hypothetical protein